MPNRKRSSRKKSRHSQRDRSGIAKRPTVEPNGSASAEILTQPIVPKESVLPPVIPDRGFASTVQAATFLNCTRQHIAKLIGDGLIPARRFGRCWRIPWQWLLEQERYTAA